MSKAKKIMEFLKDDHLILEKIEVTKLFGRYNYTLDLSPKNDLTIIFGINGTGKTTLLKSIDNFCKLRLNEIKEEEFEELILKFNTTNPNDIYSIEIVFSHNKILTNNQEELFNIKIKTDNELTAEIKFTFDEYLVLYDYLRIRYIWKDYISKSHKFNDISSSIEVIYEGPSLKDMMEETGESIEDLKALNDFDVVSYEIMDGLVEKNDKEELKNIFLSALSFSCFFISSMRLTVNSLTSLIERIKSRKPMFIGLGAPSIEEQLQNELQMELNELKDFLFIDAVIEISDKIRAAKKSNTLNPEYIQIFQKTINHFLKYSNRIIECNNSAGILIKDILTEKLIPI